MRALVLALALTFASCGGGLSTNQKLVSATQVSLQGAALALGAYDLQHQHAVLAAVVARKGTLADFTREIGAYRKARGEAVDALAEALSAAADAAKKPSDATIATLALEAQNLYVKLRTLGIVLKLPDAAKLPEVQ